MKTTRMCIQMMRGINNRWKCIIMFLLLCITMLFLSSCQSNPTREVVTSKGDGDLEARVTIAAEETHTDDAVQDVVYALDFDSTDMSVNYKIQLNQTIRDSNMPVVRVTPHFINAEDAKKVATALFPDGIFYEAEPARAAQYSRSELQSKINRWSQYTNVESLKNLYGEDRIVQFSEVIKEYIERYTVMYESAPTENPHALCEWTMRKTSEYRVPENELTEKDLLDDNDEISAQLVVDQIPYYYTATTRNKEDFRVNLISAYIYSGQSPVNIDERIFRAQLCRTESPTQTLQHNIQKKAEQIIADMNMGQWMVDELYVKNDVYGDINEYTICVNAVPIFNGIPVLRRTQLDSLKDETGYAAEQYYSDINFEFAPNGELLSFFCYSPLEVQEVVNSNVKVLSILELLEIAHSQLRLTDSYAFGFGMFLDYINEAVQCHVTISSIEYGLSRIKVPNSIDEYYYVPSVAFKGYSEYIGKETETVFWCDETPQTFLILNAVDGTVIKAVND